MTSLICSIDCDPVIHEAIRDAFEDDDNYALQLTATSLHEMKRHEAAQRKAIDIAIVELPEDPVNVKETVTRARNIMPRAKILLLVTTMTPAIISQTFAVRAAGCLGRDQDLALLPIYCDLIRHVMPVYPEMLGDILRHFCSWFEGLRYPPEEFALSERELDVLKLLSLGHANKVIAHRLDITEATVKVHLQSILTKMNVDNRTQAALVAFQNGLVE